MRTTQEIKAEIAGLKAVLKSAAGDFRSQVLIQYELRQLRQELKSLKHEHRN